VLAAALATLPFLGLVAYSSYDRYDADRTRATTRPAARAEIYATLLGERKGDTVSADEFARLERVLPLSGGSALEVLDPGGRVVARAGVAAAVLGADEARIALDDASRTFDVTGPDGTKRIWGFARVKGRPLTVAVALPGAPIYGPAESALRRDVLFALWAAAVTLIVAYFLAGRVTAPIRRLAARVGDGDRARGDIVALERGVDQMGETLVESEAELARRAQRLEQVLAERNEANAELRRLNEELEHRVAERTAALEEANRELEAFSYSVSHDLRAPLRAIEGFSRILVDDHSDGLSVDALRYLALVRRNTLEMGQLIDGLLAFAQLGHQPLEKRMVDVEVLVQQLVDGIKAEHDGRALEFTVEPLPPALADGALLRQVYANLLSNAVKYSEAADPARIELSSLEDGGRTVYVVKDNGVGFDMRYEDKLFQVFQRLHSDGYDGTGLGLAMVARIVHRHGGAIWAEAAPGEGATFSFTLEGGPVERKPARAMSTADV
jgi:signal transduction histidine kinase